MIDTLITVAFCLSTLLTVVILLLPSQYDPRAAPTSDSSSRSKTSVQILVLGDIGRSPRMQYHALSIAKNGGKVVVIGYKGEFERKENLLELNSIEGLMYFGPRLIIHPCRVRSSS